MNDNGIIVPGRSLVHPVRHVVRHPIGLHPINFGIQPKSIKGHISNFEDVPKSGQHMSHVSVLRTKKQVTDNHMVWAIRHVGLVPATVEVVEALSEFGFDNLMMLFSDCPELWEGRIDEINLASLGSINTDSGIENGILFQIRSEGIFTKTFKARNRENKLPLDWIFPAFTLASMASAS